jgi:alpha-L-rhamnosidase
MANQTDCPSYGYWVVQGYTTTPEYWDVGAFSQNHCMMDHIEEWFFTRLGGIQNTGMAFSTLRIAPFIPAGLKSSDVSTETSYGTVRSSWNRDGDRMQYSFDVPFGTVATIVVPCGASQHLAEGGEPLTEGYDGVISVSYGADKATVVCGGGSYLWETLVGAPPTSSDITDTYIKNAGFEQRNTGTAPWSPTYWNLTFPEGTGYGGIQSDQRNVNTKEGTYDWHIR